MWTVKSKKDSNLKINIEIYTIVYTEKNIFLVIRKMEIKENYYNNRMKKKIKAMKVMSILFFLCDWKLIHPFI